MKNNYDDNIKKGKKPYLHARTIKYVEDIEEIFTLTNISPKSLRNTNRHWGLLSAIYAYLLRTKEKCPLILLPKNLKVG